ncbi:MAG TPA: hypothetical protein VFO39_14270 [Candidatus Sulfotelmatobacter sp.]|nr:hypothetical protein [Candidatus Sulfotelmatobacter sp.]
MSTSLPILVTSLEGKHFSEVCETLVVSAHGCSMLSPTKLESGIPLRFHSKEGRETTARVVYCHPAGPDHRSWRLGARLDQPENFWGLSECPPDWLISPAPKAKVLQVPPKPPTTSHPKASDQSNQIPGWPIEIVTQRLEAPMNRLIAEAVRPLHAEIAALKEILKQKQANPSRFEVSLSAIPPELEQQLESRLQKDLAPKVLEEARLQYTNLLDAAKTTIDRKTSEGYEQFLRRVAEELKAVEKRAQDISAHLSETTEQGLHRGLEDFRKKLLEGGNSLKRLSEELLEFLRQSVDHEYASRRGDLDLLRAVIDDESLRLREHVESLDSRIAKLDESARFLESGLDQRLSVMSSNTVKETRGQLEAVSNEMLSDWTTRSNQLLAGQLKQASEEIKSVQNQAIASGTESLKAQAANTLETFQQSLRELATASSERWRAKLDSALKALVKSVGQQFEIDAGSGEKS